MESTKTFAVYVHLTPTSRPQEVCETLKLNLKGIPREPKEESKVEEDTIQKMVDQIQHHLNTVRNDGNKVYEILNVATSFDGENLKRDSSAAIALETGSDVYVKVRITVDSTKHVQPIAQNQV